MKDYKDITGNISKGMKALGTQIPETMQGFSAMAKASKVDGALDVKTKEFIALAIGVAARCDGCIGFHMEELVRLGATKEEVAEVLGVAVYMGGGPSLMYAAEATEAFEQFSKD